MAFSSGDTGGPMATINVTPLVDVMLVLLIIFMITAPLMTHKVEIKLPEATLKKIEEALKITPITLAISWPIRRGEMNLRIASTMEPWVSPVIGAVAGASP